MNTKEKILQAAIEVYNTTGINATTRHIAEHISISPGNLHYHFKHTNEIMVELYGRMEGEFDELIIKTTEGLKIDQHRLTQLINRSFSISYRYRFILLNFVEIVRRVPSIQISYKKLVERRKREFGNIFKRLSTDGYLRDDLNSDVWDSLVTQLFILNDFWLSHNELVDRLDKREASMAYSRLMQHLLVPYTS